MNLEAILKLAIVIAQLVPVIVQVVQQVESAVNASKAGEEKKAAAVAAVNDKLASKGLEVAPTAVSGLIDQVVAQFNKDGTFTHK